MKIRHIPLTEIASAEKFRYRREGVSPSLERSVKAVGVLQPVWGVEQEGVVLLDGFRRVEAARRGAVEEIPVRLFAPSQLEEAFLQALHLNLTGTGLSVLEQLLALNRAESTFPAQVPTVLKWLEYEHLPGVLELGRKVAALPDWLQDYFHRSNLSVRMLQKLLHFSPGDYEPWYRIGADLHFKGAELVNLLEQVRDVALRDSRSPAELWKNLGIETVLESARTPQQKVQEIKKIVAKTRFPLLHKIQQRVQEKAVGLERDFPGMLKVSWDRSLESPYLLLTLRLGENEERLQQRILQPAVVRKLKEIWEAINQLPEEAENEH